jgi:uncharacterized protein YjaZ
VLAACISASEPPACDEQLGHGVCLDLSAAAGLVTHEAVIAEEVMRTLDAVRSLLDVTDLRISIVADASQVIPEVGLGGYNPSADEVLLFADPASQDLEAILRSELASMLAHEIHHAMRRRAIGYGSTLLQAAVSEGLADHFSLEVHPRDAPPWARALTNEQLAVWIPEVLARSTGTYDHPEWFYGSSSVPRWTGYAVGFELVRAHLDGDPMRRASTLVDEPAASFVP